MIESRSVTNRRTFLRRAIGRCAAAFASVQVMHEVGWDPKSSSLPEPSGGATPLVPEPLRIALVAAMGRSGRTPPAPEGAVSEDEAARAGVELGTEEAARAATLLGRTVTLVATVDGSNRLAALLDRERIHVVICAASAETIAEVLAVSTSQSTVLFNLGEPSDALRNGRCAKRVFHVAASDAMLADARRTWAEGETTRASDATIELWHSALERYGAGQLNARYVARFRRPMESIAWAAWFAVKVAWESSQRASSAVSSELIAHLERETTRFDGHKGIALSFRPWDHQLRQPLYVIPTRDGADTRGPDSGVVAVPAADTLPANVALDVLGTSQSRSTCRW